MSTIPTKQIDGDVSVGRNVTTGGDANVQGNARIGHDLVVEGWLEAKNIKGANKGLFASVTALRRAYPQPHDGWFAGVAATEAETVSAGASVSQGRALFWMYTGDGGDWVRCKSADNVYKLYEIVVDNEQVDNLRSDLTSLQSQHNTLSGRVDGHDTRLANIESQQTTLNNTVNSHTTQIGNLQQADTTINSRITNLGTELTNFKNTRGQANGLASLDGSGKVPAAQLPGYVDDVIEFNATIEDVTIQNVGTSKKSTDAGCMVLYNTDTNRFVLAVTSVTILDDVNWDNILRPTLFGLTTVVSKTPEIAAQSDEDEGTQPNKVVGLTHALNTNLSDVERQEIGNWWLETDNGLVVNKASFTYYSEWGDRVNFGEGDASGAKPESGKIYTCTSTNMTYRWGGASLITIGSGLALGHTASTAFPGDEGAALQEQVENQGKQIANATWQLYHINILPCDGQWDGKDNPPTYGVWLCPNESGGVEFRSFGNCDYYGYGSEEYNTDENANTGPLYRMEDGLYRVRDGKLESISGSAVGNCYNVTAARVANGDTLPTNPPTYDNKQSAIEYAIAHGAVSIGVQITYAASAKGWRSFQYIGLSEDPESYANLENWLDIAGQSAGEETILNINELCKEQTGSSEYTLMSAVAALKKLCESKGLDYFKDGLVITYCVNAKEHTWEAKQLLDKASADNDEAWKDFGDGGGTNLVANATPTSGGEDAFSTGGAYDRLIVDFEEGFSEDGNSKTYQPVNAARKPIGSAITVPLGGGGGSTDATTFAVRFESQTIYGAAGGKITGRFAARSVTRMGEEEAVNNITEITVKDGNTGVILKTEVLTNERSSASLQDWKFTVDFTDWFEGAGQRSFIVSVKDQEGNVRNVDVSVNCVDVTVEISKSLNECRVSKGAGMTTLTSFYLFPRNTLGGNGGGIDAIIEILWDGEWRELGSANIQKTFSQDISINPSNVLGGGEKMEHGAYLLRIHGYAPNAKVTGNYVYTTIMCVDTAKSTEPIVAIRYDAKTYDDEQRGTVALYDNVNLQIAAYTGASVSGNTEVVLRANGETIQTFNASSSSTYSVRYQVQGYTNGDEIDFEAEGRWKEANGTIHRSTSPQITVTVDGSAIDVQLKGGAAFGYDFALRTNADVDKTISDNGVTMSIEGANWRTNGFVNYLGENCLRIAENMKAQVPYRPFALANAESAGLAVQFAFATNNIKDKDALLMHSYDPTSGTGFYVKGNVAGIYCSKGVGTKAGAKLQERKFRCGEKITMAVVVEPASRAIARGNEEYSTIKMYLNGEEVACLGYIPGQNAISQNTPLTFDGTDGDLYLYYLMGYESYYEWTQAFPNYLAKLTNVSAMMSEFDSEDVLDNLNRPSLDKLKAKGMPYYVVVAAQSVFDEFDSDVNTSTKFNCTLFYFNPEYPELNFKATNVQWRRQGTTSAKRPIKNDRFYLNKQIDKKNPLPQVVTLLNPNENTELGRKAIALAAKNYVLVNPDAIPVQIITVKVDYSDSSNANDCGVCDMMNNTFKAMGSAYQTPAQRAYDGTFTKGDLKIEGCKMDHSTKNHPIAAFRATNEQLTDAWFHAKGNWKEDKGEQLALGFKDTPGYNKGCLNYGDFIEFFGNRGETLTQIETRFKATEGLKTDSVYLLSQYCGRDYIIMRHDGEQWKRSTGSMKQVNGKWVVTGDVLNPVTGFELLSYQEFCWWKGVSSIDEMMAMEEGTSSWVQKLVASGDVSAKTFPKWTQYFECMIDDDQLQIDLAYGRKVPYDLYRMLKFCNDCDMIVAVDGKENRWKIVEDPTKTANWRDNLWQYASPQSLYAYTLFTDYLAATDQRAKNMQPMWFLEDGQSVTNGVYSADHAVRMYLNKVYDCDTCNGKDNDGGCTVDPEADPNRMTDDNYVNPYAGYGSILFNNVATVPTVYLDATHSASQQLSLTTVAAAMRSAKTTVDGQDMVPFSPEGAQYFFVEKRLKFWRKLISSYDGERKYIESVGKSDDIYFYALQGLGLTALPQFIDQRWKIRDGYYQTGQFFTGVLSFRAACSNSNARIRVKAAKTGYIGIGHDSSGQRDEVVFLEAGQEHYFTKFSHTEGALIYIYQADRLSEIDLSEISIDGGNFSVMTLAEKIIIGSETHEDVAIGSYTPISSVSLGSLPFLRELDVRNTTVEGIDASSCPRIESIKASGTHLRTCQVAETSPISVLELPDTMSEISLVNLPNLSYPGGLKIAGLSNVTKLMVSGSPKIDAMTMIENIVEQAGSIKSIGLRDVNITASVDILRSLRATNAFGLDENGNDIAADKNADGVGKQCTGLTGRWILSELIEDEDENGVAGFNTLKAYFPALELHNSQFSIVKCDDKIDAPGEKWGNLDNLTGALFGAAYKRSGHPLRIFENTWACRADYNQKLQRMELRRLSRANFNYMLDGSEIDLADVAGAGYDIMHLLGHGWYKGVSDYRHQDKYYIWSSCDEEPLSSANVRRIHRLGDVLYRESQGLYVNDNTEVSGVIEDLIGQGSNVNIYRVDVEGMKQVRWPGMNNQTMGCAFTDADGNIVGLSQMAVSNSNFDFTIGNYIFDKVPAGAKWFYFTTFKELNDGEVHVVDSDSIEAIEPEWTEITNPKGLNEEVENGSVIGTYPITIDGLGMPRSISSGRSRKGTGTSTINPNWLYDDEGTAQELPSGVINYTMKDFQNLARLRGKGYQLQDYEQHKETSILWWSLNGHSDEQSLVGRGVHDGQLNAADATGMADTQSSANVWNSILGIKGYVGCDSEWLDYIALNVTSYKEFLKNRGAETATFPLDGVAHILNPLTGEERTVQCLTSGGGNNIVRLVHGAKCDILPSRTISDTSQYVVGFCAGYWYSNGRSRVVLRSGNSSSANSGLACAGAHYACSYSSTYYGARLAFRGRLIVLS